MPKGARRPRPLRRRFAAPPAGPVLAWCNGSVARRLYSCIAQPLPSGSVKYMKVAPSGGGVLDRFGDVQAPADEFRTGRLDVGDTELEPLIGAGGRGGAGVGSHRVSPRAIEQPEPGGVSWTMRMPGTTSWSMSTWKPTLSR